MTNPMSNIVFDIWPLPLFQMAAFEVLFRMHRLAPGSRPSNQGQGPCFCTFQVLLWDPRLVQVSGFVNIRRYLVLGGPLVSCL
jgi:hypothetical protein